MSSLSTSRHGYRSIPDPASIVSSNGFEDKLGVKVDKRREVGSLLQGKDDLDLLGRLLSDLDVTRWLLSKGLVESNSAIDIWVGL